jgi:hypothetical protein
MTDDQNIRLMTMFIGRVTPQDEARWRAALNRLGPEGVRARLAQLTSFDADEMVEIGDFMPLPSRQFVEAWLHRKDRTKRRINAFMVLATLIATVAAVVAAFPIIKTWWAAP